MTLWDTKRESRSATPHCDEWDHHISLSARPSISFSRVNNYKPSLAYVAFLYNACRVLLILIRHILCNSWVSFRQNRYLILSDWSMTSSLTPQQQSAKGHSPEFSVNATCLDVLKWLFIYKCLRALTPIYESHQMLHRKQVTKFGVWTN